MTLREVFAPSLGRKVKLGYVRRPAQGPHFKLRHYLGAALPDPPATVDYTVGSASMTAALADILGNDALGDCHDDKTEVLTEHGWRFWAEYDGKSLLGTMNPATRLLEFQAPISVRRREHKGRMIVSDHKRLDFAVTPNHRMLVQPYKIPKPYTPGSSGYTDQRFVSADSLPTRCLIPGTTSGFIGVRLDRLTIGHRSWNGGDLLRLLATVLADGYVRQGVNKNVVSFCCFRDDRREMIASLAHRLELHEQPSRAGVWSFSDGALADWLRTHAYVGDAYAAPFKRVPDLVKVASQGQIEEFLNFYGDQCVGQDGDRQFYTTSRRLADDLQELLLRVGKRSSIYEQAPRAGGINSRGDAIVGHFPLFTVSENRTSDVTITRSKRNPGVAWDDYNGEVYCATVPNSTLITRRNNRVLISGNCVIACQLHQLAIWTGNASGVAYHATRQQAVDLYSKVTGYNPNDPSTDRGTDPTVAMDFVVANGFPNGDKPLGWVRVDAGNPRELRQAIWLFEGCGFAIGLPDAYVASMPQADGFVWDVNGESNPNNGHMFLGCGFQDGRVKIDSWGLLGWFTDDAIAQYASISGGGEIDILLSLDMISAALGKAPSGFDAMALIADFDAMGGSVGQPPAPTPIPPSPPGTQVTCPMAQSWVSTALGSAAPLLTRQQAIDTANAALAAGWPSV